MDNRQYISMLILALLGGLIGGVFSNHLFTPGSVMAQKETIRAKTVEAQLFRVVDENGTKSGSWGITPRGTLFALAPTKQKKGQIFI